MMNLIYNSENYYVVEYPDERAYELVDKRGARGTLFQGDAALRFRNSIEIAVTKDASVEDIDELLDSFDVLLNYPVVIH